MHLIRFFAAVLALAVASAPALPSDALTKAQVETAEAVAVNNALVLVYHEVAHLLIDQLDLPVLGREEDAADNLATYMLLQKRSKENDLALADAAFGWMLNEKAYPTEEEDFYDEHSLDRQRAYQIVCMMVGSDAEAFGAVADKYGIDKDRQDRCGRDFALLERSFDSLMNRHSARNSKAGTSVEITYHAASLKLARAKQLFDNSGIFEGVAEHLESQYGLTNAIDFRARSCGEANAFYYSENVQVLFCYEQLADYLKITEADIASAQIEAQPTSGLGRAGAH